MSTPALLLAEAGYVAGELLRLIAGHRSSSCRGELRSQPGERIANRSAILPRCIRRPRSEHRHASMILTKRARRAVLGGASWRFGGV